MKAKKSLQKFTENKIKPQEITETNSIEWLFGLKKVTYDDLRKLSKADYYKAHELMNEKLNSLTGKEHDKFVEQFIGVWCDETKNQLWEHNHTQIIWAISTLIQEYGRMPTNSEIALKTGKSRQTIHKHLKEYKNSPLYLEQKEQYKFASDKLLAKMFQFALQGDIKAARLYFDVLGMTNKEHSANKTSINNQNNYIQINNTVLSQDVVKSLPPEQLNIIESFLNTVIKETSTTILQEKHS